MPDSTEASSDAVVDPTEVPTPAETTAEPATEESAETAQQSTVFLRCFLSYWRRRRIDVVFLLPQSIAC